MLNVLLTALLEYRKTEMKSDSVCLSLSVSASASVSVCLCLSVSVCVSIRLSVAVAVSVSVYICLSVCLPLSLSLRFVHYANSPEYLSPRKRERRAVGVSGKTYHSLSGR